MKNYIFLFLLFSCIACASTKHNYTHKQYKQFIADKNRTWQINPTTHLLADPKELLCDTFNVTLWKKYQAILLNKDTTYILKQFGQPNKKINNGFSSKSKIEYQYFITYDCYLKTIPEGRNSTTCDYISFIFSTTYKLESIKYGARIAQINR